MDTDSSLKAGTDVYLANDFQHCTLSQAETSMDKGFKKKNPPLLQESAKSSAGV
jgi:hypothetical protein